MLHRYGVWFSHVFAQKSSEQAEGGIDGSSVVRGWDQGSRIKGHSLLRMDVRWEEITRTVDPFAVLGRFNLDVCMVTESLRSGLTLKWPYYSTYVGDVVRADS